MVTGALLAAAAPESGHGVAGVLLALVAIFVSTKLLGEVAQRLRQPAVLGELIAGVLLGASVLGFVDPSDPVIAAMAELGVVILLFAIGLQTELASLLKVGANEVVSGEGEVVLAMTDSVLRQLGATPDQLDEERARVRAELLDREEQV